MHVYSAVYRYLYVSAEADLLYRLLGPLAVSGTAPRYDVSRHLVKYQRGQRRNTDFPKSRLWNPENLCGLEVGGGKRRGVWTMYMR